MTREEAIKTLQELRRETNDSWYEEVYNMAIEALQFAKYFDLLKEYQSLENVVRCKDCIHGIEDYPQDIFPNATETTYSCDHSTYSHDKDFYCKYGEKRNYECK